MANELNQARFETLLLGAKSSIRRHASKFSGLRIDSVRVGFFTRTATLPVITVMPVRWTKGEDLANRKYRVTRMLEFQVFVRASDSRKAQETLRSYIEQIRTIVQNENYSFFFEHKNTVPQGFNYEFIGVNYNPNAVASSGRGGIFQANIRISIKSKERRPAQPEKTPLSLDTVDTNQATDAIFKSLSNYRTTKLRSIKEFRRDSESFKRHGTTLSVVLENENTEAYSAGADLIDLLYDIVVRSKLIADEASILKVCEQVETLKDILDEDESFKGLFWNSIVDSIGFEQQLREKTAYYIARISFIARWLRSTRFKTRG